MKLFKKLNTKGFGHLEILILIVVVVVIAAAGTFVYEHHHNKAHANNWELVGNYGGSSGDNIYACKTYINAYGGIYQVQLLFEKPAGWTVTSYNATDLRPSGEATQVVSSQSGDSFWDNTTATLTVNSSAYYGDTINAVMYGLYGTSAKASTPYSSNIHPQSLNNC